MIRFSIWWNHRNHRVSTCTSRDQTHLGVCRSPTPGSRECTRTHRCQVAGIGNESICTDLPGHTHIGRCVDSEQTYRGIRDPHTHNYMCWGLELDLDRSQQCHNRIDRFQDFVIFHRGSQLSHRHTRTSRGPVLFPDYTLWGCIRSRTSPDSAAFPGHSQSQCTGKCSLALVGLDSRAPVPGDTWGTRTHTSPNFAPVPQHRRHWGIDTRTCRDQLSWAVGMADRVRDIHTGKYRDSGPSHCPRNQYRDIRTCRSLHLGSWEIHRQSHQGTYTRMCRS